MDSALILDRLQFAFVDTRTTTTPFDMCVLNDLDRFHLAIDVIERVPRLAALSGHLIQSLRDRLTDHRLYICEHGEDIPKSRRGNGASLISVFRPTNPMPTLAET